MKRLFMNGLVAIAMFTSVGTIAPAAEAKFTAATVSEAGVLRGGRDQFFEVTVEGDPLQRVRVECVTFHRLDGLDIYVGGEKITPDVRYGFEEFTLTFAEDIADGETIRIVMKNSRVRGTINEGIDVPYRVYGTYASLNNSEVPLGTAVIRTPGDGGK
ncbi:MAG: hypothetical protein AAGA46_12480 [Cyanobacteria bacterium P01_F01_bin.13]